MNKIFLVIQREYLERVKKKSFIIMTLLTPILLAALMILPALLMNMDDDNSKIIAVVNQSKLFNKDESLIKRKNVSFKFIKDEGLEIIKEKFKEENYYAILYLTKEEKFSIFSEKNISIETKMTVSDFIEEKLEIRKRNSILMKIDKNIDAEKLEKELYEARNININLETIIWGEDGRENKGSTEIAAILGIGMGFLIYIFIFMYGAQVMRGVIEEKTSRIIEIIISSIKPFQLMMGKIVGIALVGLTQFLIWVILLFALTNISKAFLIDNIEKNNKDQIEQILEQSPEKEKKKINKLFDNLTSVDLYSTIIKSIAFFIFYFLGGYLLYSSLFAAVGAAVDNETDTQQFMIPISLPLILSFIVAQIVIKNPDSQIAFWFSIIPFTSPIIMLIRIPFDPPIFDIILSSFLLILSFILTTWMASKIYRVGILMYGKKVSYKELWKWLRY